MTAFVLSGHQMYKSGHLFYLSPLLPRPLPVSFAPISQQLNKSLYPPIVSLIRNIALSPLIYPPFEENAFEGSPRNVENSKIGLTMVLPHLFCFFFKDPITRSAYIIIYQLAPSGSNGVAFNPVRSL
jgi:hypothetical protein